VTDYTPEFEDCQLPTEAKNYCEDGMPKFIILGMRDWKSRSPKCIRQQEVYKLRLQMNPLSLDYCPVHWITLHWELRARKGKQLTGPIIKKLQDKTFKKNLKKLFVVAGIPSCSGHSIRRTAAQWARRSGADLFTILNVGRWTSLENLRLYLKEADKIGAAKMDANDQRDPLLDFWVFNSKTQIDTVA
jgi:integrase